MSLRSRPHILSPQSDSSLSKSRKPTRFRGLELDKPHMVNEKRVGIAGSQA